MKINEGLYVLELGPEERRMNITMVCDDDNVVLVDAGLPSQIKDIREEMLKADVEFERINKIIITHHDIDHIGSLADIINDSHNEIEILAHPDEKPYIEGTKMPIKFTQERLSSIPEERRNEMIEQIHNLKRSKVDRTMDDEEELNYCGGIKIIHTPGHTLGHICLYLKKYKTLVSGDALNVVNGKLVGPKPEYTFNMIQAMESLKKLTKYDIEKVICYHGGVFSNNPNERIQEIINSINM